MKGHRIQRFHVRLRKFVDHRLLGAIRAFRESMATFIFLYSSLYICFQLAERVQDTDESLLGPSTCILMVLVI